MSNPYMEEAAKINRELPKCADRQERESMIAEALARAVREEREKVAKWMLARSYATGHGDTVEAMLAELEWQAKERGTKLDLGRSTP